MPIASLSRPVSPLEARYRDFLAALQAGGFAGEIRADHANRTVQATDNSIYQRLPQAVISPAHADDVRLLARVLAQPEHRGVAVAARGGGTGTNGQSLTDGVIVDLS
ncbi:MAG: FAD-binding protein, partial [Burkholderia vietnamiensis]|nr:FAD-binding protein [Burkholderia vietnamiensis]